MTKTPASPLVARLHPAGGAIGAWQASDGWALRRFDWPAAAESPARGSLLFLGGRGDFFEKYLESLAHWHELGWGITSFDWRGQAGSGRTTDQPQVGDIADFALYIDDLRAFWIEWVAQTPPPHVVVAHSMGGHLVLRALAEGAIAPDAAVLSAPMLGLHAPIGPRFGQALAEVMARLGTATRAAWSGNEKPYTLTSRRDLLTHDHARYADELWWQKVDPRLVTGPPSWRWVRQAFASTRALQSDGALSGIATPVLLLIAEADRLVDPKAALAVADRLRDARIVRFGAESAHEILREADPVRDRALAEIDAFLDARAPGAAA